MPSPSDSGQCTECGEWCELANPCCGAPVIFEGTTYTVDYFDEEFEADFDRTLEVYQDLKKEGY